MALLPENTNTTAHAIYRMHAERNAKQPPRGYLGWSQIGEPCKRQLWYSFRLSKKPNVEGRIARLFDTGHREEDRVIRELEGIGCKVYSIDPNTGGQYGVSSHGGHFKGHLDCVVLGLPEAPKTYHLVDVKTIKSKKFDQLLKDGMQKMYPKYWSQAHGYMGLQGLERAMFIFICKDDDRIHCERFPFDKATFERDMAKALEIINAAEPPARISNDASWFECKFCNFHSLCHGTDMPDVHCRSCAYASPDTDAQNARWVCSHHSKDLSPPDQLIGCDSHRFIPPLLANFATPSDFQDGKVIYLMKDGSGQFSNGDLTSKEIAALHDKASLPNLLNDTYIIGLREHFGAEVVG